MPHILVTPEQLQTIATQFSQSANDIQSIASKVQGAANALDWETKQKAGIDQRIADLNGKARLLSQQTLDLSGFLRNKGQEFITADSQASSWFTNVGNQISNSLMTTFTNLGNSVWPLIASLIILLPWKLPGLPKFTPPQKDRTKISEPPGKELIPNETDSLISTSSKKSKTPNLVPPLGSLSEKYESGGDPGRVSSGAGDIGGASYGAYQLTSSGGGGNVARFLKSDAGSPWANEFNGLVPGSKAFTEKWKEIASRDHDNFLEAQHDYIKLTHYDPLVQRVETIGLDVENRSRALQNTIWSTGVQHGGSTNLIEVALKGKDPRTMSDVEIIKAIYAERSRTNPDGTLLHFKSSSTAVQKGVANRFAKELNDALNMLASEQGQPI